MTLQQLRSRWKDRKLFISQLQTGPIEQKLKMPRLALLKAIHVGSPTDPIMQYGSNNYSHEGLQKLLGVLRKFKNITELFLTNVKVNHLPTLQLAKIVKNLDTLDLTYTDITLQQPQFAIEKHDKENHHGLHQPNRSQFKKYSGERTSYGATKSLLCAIIMLKHTTPTTITSPGL